MYTVRCAMGVLNYNGEIHNIQIPASSLQQNSILYFINYRGMS